MPEYQAMLLSDHLLEALAAMNRAREAAHNEKVNHREIVVREITSAEHSLARALHFIVGRGEA
jgi:hypothetical protein